MGVLCCYLAARDELLPVCNDFWSERCLQFSCCFSFHNVACLNRSEQALECEETAVASVTTVGPSDDAAAPGISKFHVFVCNHLQHVILRYVDH